ncbi:uncharacterized protein [Nicotiana sylvestris]|uniref:uncharacterized protein n=1 Tax=Nicotiana sylvestris TaxID=4096 RepID=UPI00388C4831
MAKETVGDISFQTTANVARRIEMFLTLERRNGFDKRRHSGGFSGALFGGRGSGSYMVCCDAFCIGLGAVLMQDVRVIAYPSRKLKVHEKNYPVHEFELAAMRIMRGIHGSSELAVFVQTKGSQFEAGEVVGAIERALANQFVRLDVSEPSRVLTFTIARSSLFENIRERQYDDPHLLVLRDKVQHSGAKQVTVGDDRVLRMQGHICVPNVDGIRELILEEDHGSWYSIHLGVAKMY